MNSYTSRKIIVAGGMVVVVGIGVVIFALRVHSETSVAQTPKPATPVAQTPADARAAADQIPIAPAAVVPPDAPAAVPPTASVGTKNADTATASAVEPKPARNRHLAKADTSAVATNGTHGTGTHTVSAADTSGKPAAEPAASVKSAAESTPPPATGSSPADDQKVETSTPPPPAASDAPITTDVKSDH